MGKKHNHIKNIFVASLFQESNHIKENNKKTKANQNNKNFRLLFLYFIYYKFIFDIFPFLLTIK